MSALVYISKDLNPNRRRAKSSCARCSTANRDRHTSPGRATYLPSAKSRNLSLEIDGRQSRASRRSTSSGRDHQRQNQLGRNGKNANSHCYVLPYANGASETVTSPSTYKNDFQSPMEQVMTRNNGRTIPSSKSTTFASSPSSSSKQHRLDHLSSSLSSSPFQHSGISSRATTPTAAHATPHPRYAMTRSVTVDNDFGSTKTTYMDHFSWNGI